MGSLSLSLFLQKLRGSLAGSLARVPKTINDGIESVGARYSDDMADVI